MERNHKLDWLRSIGTMLVILAHASPPPILRNIRCFDVCLLFLVSGFSFDLTNRFKSGNFENFNGYVVRRVKRLAIPAWCIVTLIYLGTSSLCLLAKADNMYSFKDYILSMLFTNQGLGYVWIVKLYLFNAIMLPLCSAFFYQYSKMKKWVCGCSAILVYTVICYFYTIYLKANMNLNVRVLIEEFLLCPVAYFIVTVIGVALNRDNKNTYRVLTLAVPIFALCQMINYADGFVPNSYKWPPNLYYLSYGIMVSILLYLAVPNRKVMVIEWISRHSYDIYLYHIPFIILLMICRSERLRIKPELLNNCFFCYAVLLAGGIGTTLLFEYVKKLIHCRK